jgi:hypothetical protein
LLSMTQGAAPTHIHTVYFLSVYRATTKSMDASSVYE